MRRGHRDAQTAFLELGRTLGYSPAKTFSTRYPTDGVWYLRARDDISDTLPVVAIEVVVSESPKTMRGSVGVLEAVSPALGVLLIQEEDIARRLRRSGSDEDAVRRHLGHLSNRALDLATSVHQRVEVWTYSQLMRRHHLAVANKSGRRPAA